MPVTSKSKQPLVRFTLAAAALALVWSISLAQWVVFALGSSLYSHVILVPAVTVFLVWMRRHELPECEGSARIEATLAASCGLAALAFGWLTQPSEYLEPNHRLTWHIAAFVCFIVSAGFLFLGRRFMRANIVAAGFLVFMIPMPGWLERGTEIALQRGSAEAADFLFGLSGLPYLRDGQVFRLPSITMEIAQECSGIHSSLVLFIVSIVAGQMFLRPGWRRWVLTLAVIPLALIRNGFRVLTLGWLCEEIGPHMIHHWIHHRGGPVFFALSLGPFFLLLVLLRWTGRAPRPSPERPEASPGSAVAPEEIPTGPAR